MTVGVSQNSVIDEKHTIINSDYDTLIFKVDSFAFLQETKINRSVGKSLV